MGKAAKWQAIFSKQNVHYASTNVAVKIEIPAACQRPSTISSNLMGKAAMTSSK
ncbi:hypothetical protein ACLOJK_024029, partial [Asimina triloba]